MNGKDTSRACLSTMVMIVSIMVSYVALVYFYQTLAVFQV